jgi:hypothetical protein
MSIIDAILSGNASKAKELIEERLAEIVAEKLESFKMQLQAEEFLDEKITRNVVKTGRTKLIKLRVRKGKVQRRKKFSAVKGYTIRKGRMVRMSSVEKQHRRIGARKAKIKRRGKLSTALRKRRISLRRRRTMGL